MTHALQEQLQTARSNLSTAAERVFTELGELYVAGYGERSWGCTQDATVNEVNWTFKYTTEDDELQFVCGTYTYDNPEFELNHYTYDFERVGTTTESRDVYVVSQYSPPNAWDVLHVLPTLLDAVDAYISDLTNFNQHADSKEELLNEHESVEEAISDLRTECESFTDTITTVQNGMSFTDLLTSIEESHEDLCAVGICDEEDDKDSVWKMFNWFGSDGPEPTNRDIKFRNESIALVEVERCYQGDWYSVGYVVGVDDGDTPFFIHRLRSVDELEEHDGAWTEDEVYDLMGFDKNLDSDSIEFGTRYRVQGDVYLERRELDEEVKKHRRSHTRNVLRNTFSKYAEGFFQNRDFGEYFTIDPYSIRTQTVTSESSPLFQWSGDYSTDEVKIIQDEVNISEEQVRDEQDNREYNRLSAKRRKEIVRDLLEDRFFQWCVQQQNHSLDDHHETAETNITDAYFTTEESCPLTLGNHLINVLNATIHPDSSHLLEEDIEVVVPEETQAYFIHDEHTAHIITLPRGIYTFGFLDQHFNA